MNIFKLWQFLNHSFWTNHFYTIVNNDQTYWEYLGWHSFHTTTRNFTMTFFWKKHTVSLKKNLHREIILFFKCCHTNNKDPVPWSDEDWNAAPPQVGPQSTAATLAGISKFCLKNMRPFLTQECSPNTGGPPLVQSTPVWISLVQILVLLYLNSC